MQRAHTHFRKQVVPLVHQAAGTTPDSRASEHARTVRGGLMRPDRLIRATFRSAYREGKFGIVGQFIESKEREQQS